MPEITQHREKKGKYREAVKRIITIRDKSKEETFYPYSIMGRVLAELNIPENGISKKEWNAVYVSVCAVLRDLEEEGKLTSTFEDSGAWLKKRVYVEV
jgi:hypothetical protein